METKIIKLKVTYYANTNKVEDVLELTFDINCNEERLEEICNMHFKEWLYQTSNASYKIIK
jgi:hypothetical protein